MDPRLQGLTFITGEIHLLGHIVALLITAVSDRRYMQGLMFMIGEMGVPLDHIAVLSIGTGTAVADLRKGVLKEGRRGWGMLEWILPNQGNIVTTIMDGTAEAGQAIVEVLFRVCFITFGRCRNCNWLRSMLAQTY